MPGPWLLEALVASAPDALYVVDAAGAILLANPAAIALLGYENEGELTGRPSHATIHNKRPDGSVFPEHECPLLRSRDTGTTVRVDRDAFVRRDGSMVPVAYASAPIEVQNGRGAIVSFRDINAELRAEEALAARAAQEARLDEIRASRARLVQAGEQERARLARDLHDGAQQRLVQAMIELQLAQRDWDSEPDSARTHVQAGLDAARAAIADLRELAAGIHPRVLVDRGLPAALATLADRSASPVILDVAPGRHPPSLEAAAYFLVAEALTNAAKHAEATEIRVTLVADGADLLVEVRDDGIGGAAADGSGLRGLADRVAAVGGTMAIDSPARQGTVVRARLPLNAAGT